MIAFSINSSHLVFYVDADFVYFFYKYLKTLHKKYFAHFVLSFYKYICDFDLDVLYYSN